MKKLIVALGLFGALQVCGAAEGPKKCVLVVDDAPIAVMLLNKALTRAGFDVLYAMNPDCARSTLLEKHVDVVITDNDMPDLNQGVELIRWIRMDKKATGGREGSVKIVNMPVIAQSGREESEDLMLQAGANAFFLKPFKVDAIITKLEELIGLQDDELLFVSVRSGAETPLSSESNVPTPRDTPVHTSPRNQESPSPQ